MAWYKIADGPLDIVGKTLKVVTSLSDTPIICSEWADDNGIHKLYVRDYDLDIRESIYVLDNFPGDWYLITNGTFPLTGIFVSENIRSISIEESEEVHKIDAKYVNAPPCIVLNSELYEFDDVNFYGIAQFSARAGSEPTEVSLSVSDGSEILEFFNKFVLNGTHDAGYFGELDFDNSGKTYFYPGENEGTQLELYMVLVGNPSDITSVKVLPLIIRFQTTGLPA